MALLECIHGSVDAGRLALQPSPAFHLNLSLDEVGGRGHQLTHPAPAHIKPQSLVSPELPAGKGRREEE